MKLQLDEEAVNGAYCEETLAKDFNQVNGILSDVSLSMRGREDLINASKDESLIQAAHVTSQKTLKLSKLRRVNVQNPCSSRGQQ